MSISALKFALPLFVLISIFGCINTNTTYKEIPDNEIPDVPDRNEIVMSKGMKITATTHEGTIIITAGKGLKRSYTWEGSTRSVVMWPRSKRWYGSLGIYFPGPGDHWEKHNGITRGVVQEGQMHFDTMEDALEWLKPPHSTYKTNYCVYKNDGLVICYSKDLRRHQLNVDLWQIFIGGKILSKYQESAAIDECKRGEGYVSCTYYPAHMKKSCHIGGEKPKSLLGSQDDNIKVEFLQ
jgi:hypothetical protein